ncbi:hypothetical protein SAMN05444365_1011154 [Micromonospora pattaloongensis]|uniref:Uncharacterized protein n=1 Tax=Micromonospora pattaloongensis TaxID=405436 RepID=A0A1H3I892_9ACTN|nr:hypothetical protein SAMN05444365_1011154 [Micromonospora pattaloongensis]
MPLYLAVAGVLAAAVLGFAGGMVTYQKSRRWCTICGSSLRCPRCARWNQR